MTLLSECPVTRHTCELERFLGQGVLCADGQLPQTPRELDLLARIAVCQGRLSEARRLWEAALSKDPQNSTCHDYLERLGNLPRFRIWSGTALPCAIWTTNIFAVATLVYKFLLRK